MAPPTPRPRPPARRQFASTILVLEAFVVFFATVVAYGLRVAPGAVVWSVGLGAAAVLALAAGLVGRRGGYVVGSLVQVLVLAGGLVVPMMGAVGAVFVVLWVVALVLGARIDAERAAWDAAHPPV